MTRPVIAIVDGDWVFPHALQQGLDAAGYFTIIWPEDEQSGEWPRRAAPELIILDLDWGRVGPGQSILRLLRQDPATWALPLARPVREVQRPRDRTRRGRPGPRGGGPPRRPRKGDGAVITFIIALAPLYLPEHVADHRGQSLVEYALIIVLIAIAVIVAITALGGQLGTVFSRITASLNACC